jgi:hypothetical protein
MIDQKQPENMEYLNCLGSMITNDARCTSEMKSRIVMAKAAFKKKKTFHQQIGLTFKEEAMKYFYGAETWIFRKIIQKYRGSLKCSVGEGWIRSFGPTV